MNCPLNSYWLIRDYQLAVNRSVIKFKTFAPLRLCGEYLCLLILISYKYRTPDLIAISNVAKLVHAQQNKIRR